MTATTATTATATTTATRRRPRARRTAALLAALALMAACGDDDDGAVTELGDDESSDETSAPEEGAGAAGAATAGFLAQAAEASSAEAYQVSLTVSADGGPAGEMVAGSVDGATSDLTVDIGAVVEAFGGAGAGMAPPGDLTMHMIGDTTTQYLQTPIFAASGGALPPGAEVLAELDDTWGRIDLAALGLAPEDVQSALGGQGASPQALLDVVGGAAEPEELGDDEIRGEPVTGLRADVRIGDVMAASAASGADPDQLGLEGADGPVADETIPFEVWVGDDGLVRRISYDFDFEQLAQLSGQEVPPTGAPETIGYDMDLYGYGDVAPITTPTDAIDVTEAYRVVLQASGG